MFWLLNDSTVIFRWCPPDQFPKLTNSCEWGGVLAKKATQWIPLETTLFSRWLGSRMIILGCKTDAPQTHEPNQQKFKVWTLISSLTHEEWITVNNNITTYPKPSHCFRLRFPINPIVSRFGRTVCFCRQTHQRSLTCVFCKQQGP